MTSNPPPISRRTLLSGLAGSFLVAGCSAGVPGSGPVVPVRTEQPGQTSAPARPPTSGLGADEIVRGFVEALGTQEEGAGAAGAYSAARQYLTPQLQRSWDPTKGNPLLIVSDYRTDLVPDETGKVELTVNETGRLDEQRSYRPSGTTQTVLSFTLLRINGEWRISELPDEIVLTTTSFRSLYVQRRVYFLDSTGTIVVPEVRWVLSTGQPLQRATRTLALLLAGPSPDLASVVRSELVGVDQRTTPTQDADGVDRIDFTERTPLTTEGRHGLAAQVVWSLAQDLSSMHLTLNDEPLDPGQDIWTVQEVATYDPNRIRGSVGVSSDPFYIDTALQVRNLTSGERVVGPLGSGDLEVEAAAMSAATGVMAAVVNRSDGQQDLVVGMPGSVENLTYTVVARQIISPVFSRSGADVWAGVVDTETGRTEVQRVAVPISPGTVAPRSPVVLPEELDPAQLTAIALSPDNVRIAFAAGGRLFLGAIRTQDPGSGLPDATGITEVVNLREVHPDLSNVGSVVFLSTTELRIAATLGRRLNKTVVRVLIDGSDVTVSGASGLTGDVTAVAASGSEQYAAFSGRIVRLVGSFADGRWEVPAIAAGAGLLAGYRPFFPS